MMNIRFKKLIITAAFSALFPIPVFAADTIDQVAVKLKAGDYSVVKSELLSLAQTGNPRAEYNLGVSYLYGHGVPQNPARAFEWISKAANQQDLHAEVNLASMYLEGRGIKKDPEQAVSWYTKAAAQNDVNANNALAKIYRDGLAGKVDYTKSFQFFSMAEELGSAEARYNLAAFYHYGLGVPKDENKARALFSKVGEDKNKSTVASFGNGAAAN